MITIFSSLSKAQISDQNYLIRTFYEKVYDSNISSRDIVSNYVVYTDTVGYNNAVGTIESLRDPDNLGEHFSSLRKDITNKDFTLTSYSLFDDKEKAKFQDLNAVDRNNIYRLNPKNTIQQYLLIKENKICSFFGFQKTGSDTYTFIVY
jgi:hypothetical protein